jgi:hypothetical protein
MDIETKLMNELAENGTDRARELFLQWQEERIKSKESFIEKLDAVNNNCDLANVMPSLPSDGETEKWFDENIGVNSDCSASSAIYKFRLWLKERLGCNEA